MTQKKTKLAKPKQQKMDAEATAFYNKITSQFTLTTAGLELLTILCCTTTRWREVKAVLDADGCIIPGGAMPRVHPLCKVENDCRLSITRMLKELGLQENE